MSTKSLSQNDLDFMAFALESSPEEYEEEEVTISPQERAFAQQVRRGPRPPKEVSRGRSLVDAPLKGFFNIAGKALGAMPSGAMTFEETLEEAFPTQDRFLEKSLQAGTELAAGGGAAGGVPGILRSLLGGFAGEGVEAAPFIPDSLKPYLRFGAEVGALSAPGMGKTLRPTKAQQPLVDEARRLGLSEKQIAPLIQAEKKVKTLGKVAGKRFRTQPALSKSKKALDTALEGLETHKDFKKVLAPTKAKSVTDSIQAKMFKNLNSQERGLINADLQQLIESPKGAEDFIKFYRDINKAISSNPKARKALNLLKDDVIEAVQTISPELGNTFKVTNKLYSNYSKIFDTLKPNFRNDLLQLGRHAMLGMVAGHYPALVEIAGTQAAKNLSREMLINPRFQNLSRQIVHAVNKGKLGVAAQLTKKLAEATSKYSPEVARELDQFDWSTIQNTPDDEGTQESD